MALSLENVTFGRFLRSASITVDAGEVASVWSDRKTDCSALIRVAAGVGTPDSGVVRREGRLIVAQRSWPAFGGTNALDQLILPLLARHSVSEARKLALAALCDWDAEGWAAQNVYELEDHELARLALLRAIVSDPGVLLVDDPMSGLPTNYADEMGRMLFAARDRGAAILVTMGNAVTMRGADGLYTLGHGVMRGVKRERGELVEFPRRRAG